MLFGATLLLAAVIDCVPPTVMITAENTIKAVPIIDHGRALSSWSAWSAAISEAGADTSQKAILPSRDVLSRHTSMAGDVHHSQEFSPAAGSASVNAIHESTLFSELPTSLSGQAILATKTEHFAASGGYFKGASLPTILKIKGKPLFDTHIKNFVRLMNLPDNVVYTLAEQILELPGSKSQLSDINMISRDIENAKKAGISTGPLLNSFLEDSSLYSEPRDIYNSQTDRRIVAEMRIRPDTAEFLKARSAIDDLHSATLNEKNGLISAIKAEANRIRDFESIANRPNSIAFNLVKRLSDIIALSKLEDVQKLVIDVKNAKNSGVPLSPFLEQFLADPSSFLKAPGNIHKSTGSFHVMMGQIMTMMNRPDTTEFLLAKAVMDSEDSPMSIDKIKSLVNRIKTVKGSGVTLGAFFNDFLDTYDVVVGDESVEVKDLERIVASPESPAFTFVQRLAKIEYLPLPNHDADLLAKDIADARNAGTSTGIFFDNFISAHAQGAA